MPVAVKKATPTIASIEASALQSPAYQAAAAARKRALDNFQSSQGTAAQQFGVQHANDVRNLGYDPRAKKWDTGDLYGQSGIRTTSGQAYTNQLNDFGNRGMTQSGGFAAARNALDVSMGNQLSGLNSQEAKFTTDQGSALLNFQQQQEQDRLAALNQARQIELTRILGQSSLLG
jgi:hypothetical protein